MAGVAPQKVCMQNCNARCRCTGLRSDNDRHGCSGSGGAAEKCEMAKHADTQAPWGKPATAPIAIQDGHQ